MKALFSVLVLSLGASDALAFGHRGCGRSWHPGAIVQALRARDSRPACGSGGGQPVVPAPAVAPIPSSIPVPMPAVAEPARPLVTGAKAPATADDPTGLVSAINAARTSRGLRAVEPDATLTASAQRNTDTVGRTFVIGRKIPLWHPAGAAGLEIIARNQSSGAEAVGSWTRSPGHANVLYNPSFTRVGVGHSPGHGAPVWAAQFR